MIRKEVLELAIRFSGDDSALQKQIQSLNQLNAAIENTNQRAALGFVVSPDQLSRNLNRKGRIESSIGEEIRQRALGFIGDTRKNNSFGGYSTRELGLFKTTLQTELANAGDKLDAADKRIIRTTVNALQSRIADLERELRTTVKQSLEGSRLARANSRFNAYEQATAYALGPGPGIERNIVANRAARGASGFLAYEANAANTLAQQAEQEKQAIRSRVLGNINDSRKGRFGSPTGFLAYEANAARALGEREREERARRKQAERERESQRREETRRAREASNLALNRQRSYSYLDQLETTARSVGGRRRNRGKTLDQVLGRDDYNAVFGAIGGVDASSLDAFDRLRYNRALQTLGIGRPDGSDIRGIGRFSGARRPGLKGIGDVLKYNFGGIARGLGSTATLLGPGLALSGAYAAGYGISSGIRGSLAASAEIESNQLFLGGSLANFFDFGNGKFNAAQNLSAARQYASQNLIPKIRETAIASPLTYQELFQNFTTASPILFGKGLNAEQSLAVTNRLFSIGKAQGIKTSSIIDDVRALNTGIIRNAQTFQAIGVDKEEFKDLAKLKGQDLVDALDKIFEPFDETLKEYENTYQGRMARLSDQLFNLQVLIGDALAPVVIDFVDGLTKTLEQASKDGTLENFAQGVASVIDALKNGAAGLGSVVGEILRVFGDTYVNPETGKASVLQGYANLGKERKAKEASESLDATFQKSASLARDKAIAELGPPPKGDSRTASQIYEDELRKLGNPVNITQASIFKEKATESTRRIVARNSKASEEYEAKVQALTKKYRPQFQKDLLNGASNEGSTPVAKNPSGDSSSSGSKASKGLPPRPVIPVSDTTGITQQLSGFDVDQQVNTQKQALLDRRIQVAQQLGDIPLARRLLAEKSTLIQESAQIEASLATFNYDKVAQELENKTTVGLQGNPTDAIDPINGPNKDAFGFTPLGDAPPIYGAIGGRTGAIGSGVSSKQSIEAIRQSNRVTQDSNTRQQALNKLEEAERTKKLQLLKIENDLQLQLIDIKSQQRSLLKEENRVRALRVPSESLVTAQIRAGSPFATRRDSFNASKADLDLQIKANQFEFATLLDSYGGNLAAASKNPVFAELLRNDRLLKGQSRNLSQSFSLAESDLKFELESSRLLDTLDFGLTSGYSTQADQFSAIDQQVGLAKKRLGRILFRPNQEQNVQKTISEIQRLEREKQRIREATAIDQDLSDFNRNLQLKNQDGFSQTVTKNDILQREAQSALNSQDFSQTLASLQIASDPRLKGLYKKYSSLGPANFETFQNLQNELKGIVVSTQANSTKYRGQLEGFNAKLSNQQNDFISYLNGGTGLPSVEEQYSRRLAEIRLNINQRYTAEGPIADFLREGVFRQETRGLRANFSRDRAVQGLRGAGASALAAFATGSDPISAFASAAGGSLDLGGTFADLFSKKATAGQRGLAQQNIGALVGSAIIGQALPNSYSSEGSSIGGLIGQSLGGPAGVALGVLGGALFGGLFKKKSGPNPEDEARKQFQNRLLDLVSGINKSLQPAPDFFRSFSRRAIFGGASQYYGGRAYSDLNVQYNRGTL